MRSYDAKRGAGVKLVWNPPCEYRAINDDKVTTRASIPGLGTMLVAKPVVDEGARHIVSCVERARAVLQEFNKIIWGVRHSPQSGTDTPVKKGLGWMR
ncbi:Uncharacterised protein [Corynebacterium renale]|nr:Uncharacterised protein [Corynebacterium renale]SQI26033.1 Uncharacterised protein [Corynebacterium renale]STC95926.1 Uncharacterised protein [Corynebacterium renale]